MLKLAADENFNNVLLTHDVSTMTAHAYQQVRGGKSIAGCL
jgi:hypothetical protein